MMISFKTGTKVEVVTTELVRGLLSFVEAVAATTGSIAITITSVNDGTHKPLSLHYVGNALDIRSKTWTPTEKHEILKRFVGPANEMYQLILEHEGQVNEHFHLEYDPGNKNH